MTRAIVILVRLFSALPSVATTFEINSFFPIVAASRVYPAVAVPFSYTSAFSFAVKTRLAFTYYFNGESIHSSPKGWHVPPVRGTIALSGRFRLIESGRDKEKKFPVERKVGEWT